jgi:hypothetical protein
MPAGHVNRLDPPLCADGSSSLTAILILCVWKAEGVIDWPSENEEKVRRRVLIIRGEEGHTEVGKDRKMQIEKAQHPTTEQ